MRILQIIHGYPPHYMAGSEVYTWTLARELALSHEVHVFTRIENPYADAYEMTQSVEDGVTVHRLNKPGRDYTFRDKHLDSRVDEAFRRLLRELKPDVVHFGHLSHLSCNLPAIARREFGVPNVVTVHDFWLHCFRGQLVRGDLSLCKGPSTASCLACAKDMFKECVDARLVEERFRLLKDAVDCVDVFLAPSRTVAAFLEAQGVAASKIRFSPYGFDVDRIAPSAVGGSCGPLRIGFMGRVIPVKGVQTLLKAFAATRGEASLDVWGEAGAHEAWLRAFCPGDPRVRFRGAYHNGQVLEVLCSMDVLVAPSLWLENSPLVIQEAMLAHVPVIASNAGGMAELVRDGVDGYLTPLGDWEALQGLLQRLIDHPAMLQDLRPSRSRVRSIQDDASSCVDLYQRLRAVRPAPVLPMRPAPWRVTFVTNPGRCNLRCPMCDTHSPHATTRANGRPELAFEVVRRTIEELAALGLCEIIPSTMGEPLLYSHFRELLDLASQTGLTVNLTTNGTFPRGGVEAWAEALLKVVSDVKFSVNAIDPAAAGEIMQGLDVERQLASIQRYLQLKQMHEERTGRRSTATLQATFMERNLAELPKILSWAIANGFDRFKGHHLWVTWPEMAGQSLRHSNDSVRLWNETAATLTRIAEEERRPNGAAIRLDGVRPLAEGATAPGSADMLCPFLGREAWVEADGSFQVCCCPSSVRRDFGDFGSLESSSFLQIWRSQQYQNFVAGWGDHPNCRACNMRQPKEQDHHA